jgi:hypothetical protein
MPRFPLAVAATTAAMLVAAPAAGAMVQVDRGIAGARLGNTQAQVRAALGKPAGVSRGSNDFGRFVVFRYAGGLRVTFQGRTNVTGVSTTGLGDRTSRGIGVGSTEAEVAAKVPGVRCEVVGGDRLCHTGSFNAGQRMTVFLLDAGKVRRVDVAIVVD